MEADQRREWMKSRRKMRKAARGARLRRQTLRFMLLCGLLFCGGACFTHMPWSVHNEKTQIVLRGNSVASKEQVLKLLGSAMDVPIYRLDPKQLEKQLASLKAVRYAFVRRYALPQPKLVVEVLEEYPWASFSTDPNCHQWLLLLSPVVLSRLRISLMWSNHIWLSTLIQTLS
ncbi:MAG: FtsQ-type POTRA domain-containing protein [Candidatus Obscuribacter sp.]|nr:FtsQ-type POTRA domain-containing protein [Candidatus Obscuribacter sp.]